MFELDALEPAAAGKKSLMIVAESAFTETALPLIGLQPATTVPAKVPVGTMQEGVYSCKPETPEKLPDAHEAGIVCVAISVF
jgi:hypothetical protein